MIETDPIHEVEHTLALELRHLTRIHHGWTPADVQIHLRDETLVCLIEGEGLPQPSPEGLVATDDALDDMLRRTLGRGLRRPLTRTWLSETTMLAVIRLD